MNDKNIFSIFFYDPDKMSLSDVSDFWHAISPKLKEQNIDAILLPNTIQYLHNCSKDQIQNIIDYLEQNIKNEE